MEKVRLEDIGTFYTGLSGKSKEDFSDGNALFVTYRNIYNNPVLNPNINDTVVVGKNEKQNEVLRGDILFTGSSETPEDAGMSSVVLHKPKEKMYLNSFCFGFRINDFNEVIPSYLGHLLRSPSIRAAISRTAFGVTRFNINKKKFAEIEIPIPPLAVQQEIVSVLDSFTSLIEKMKEEVALRKKQMEYYREKLLAFDDIKGHSVKWMKLCDGCLYSKDRIDASDLPENSYIGVENLLKDKQGRTESTVVPLGSVIKYEKNDILIGNIRPNLRKIWKADSMGGTNGDVLCIRIKKGTTKELSSDYLFHILASENFFEYDVKYSKGGKMPRGDKTTIMKYLIPVPPLDQQHRIASTLDLFEAYITKMERLIELRQKQYEYYRDKLLTFE